MIIKIQQKEDELRLQGTPRNDVFIFFAFSAIFIGIGVAGFYAVSIRNPELLDTTNKQFSPLIFLLFIVPFICIGALILTLQKQFAEMIFDRRNRTISLTWKKLFGMKTQTFPLEIVEGFRQTYVPPKGRRGKCWELEMIFKDKQNLSLGLMWKEENAVETVAAGNEFLRKSA